MARSCPPIFLLAAVTLYIAKPTEAFCPEANVWYRLRTQMNGKGKCLDGNMKTEGSEVKMAAYMDDCKEVPSQAWMFKQTEHEGVFFMTTKDLVEREKCFDGNRFHPHYPLEGAAFMDDCNQLSGQMWVIDSVGGSEKYFTLSTLFREQHGECLFGNEVGKASPLMGAAIMLGCRPDAGQTFYAMEF